MEAESVMGDVRRGGERGITTGITGTTGIITGERNTNRKNNSRYQPIRLKRGKKDQSRGGGEESMSRISSTSTSTCSNSSRRSCVVVVCASGHAPRHPHQHVPIDWNRDQELQKRKSTGTPSQARRLGAQRLQIAVPGSTCIT